jgi:hypothetical protein
MSYDEWFARAKCKTVDDRSIFFPARGEQDKIKAAKKVCAGCPVKADCLEYVLTYPNRLQGLWGGMTEKEWRRLRRLRRKDSRLREPDDLLPPRVVLSAVKVHGRSGYVKGCRCEVCTEGERIYSRNRVRSA